MNRGVRLAVSVAFLAGCAASTPVPTPPVARPFDDVGRVAIIVSGEGSFSVATDGLEPGRTFDEILKWHPYGPALRPVAKLVHRAIHGLRNVDQVAAATRNIKGISPGSTVAQAMAQRLRASGGFEEVRTLEREPAAEDRAREGAALVRVTVPAWGIVPVREGEPDLMASFADVRAEMVKGAAGVVVWTDAQDVTHPEPAPLSAFVGDRQFARDAMTGALERAGQRLASELLYARSAGR